MSIPSSFTFISARDPVDDLVTRVLDEKGASLLTFHKAIRIDNPRPCYKLRLDS
jgi:hypothetical protein